jgi:hypothetical protein
MYRGTKNKQIDMKVEKEEKKDTNRCGGGEGRDL